MIFLYKLISHRGIHNNIVKENSYESIINALNSDKYIGVEFDIRITKDKEFILFHDGFYNNKLIKNTYYKELPKYVPKLESILKIKSKKIFLIEIKDIDNYYDKFMKLLSKYKDKNIYVMSFSNKIINKLNKENKTYKVGVLNYVLNTTKDDLKLDFIAILNSLLKENILNNYSNLEIFSYGLFKTFKSKNIFYIVDN